MNQQPLLHPHGPDRDEILRLVQFGTRQQVLGPGGFDNGVGEIQLPDGFSKECRLPRLGLDHRQRKRRDCDLHRDGRRAASRPDVEHSRMWRQPRPVRPAVTMRPLEVLGGDQRLDQQPVDGLVRRVFQRESREVDLLVPGLEETVVGAQRINDSRFQRDVRLPGPLRQPLAEFP